MKLNKKGFTLAELLIVVAIIAILIAIAIPVFTKQLEKSRDATTAANMRAAYAEAMVAYTEGTHSDGGSTYKCVVKSSDDSLGDIASELPFSSGSNGGNNTSASNKDVVIGATKIQFVINSSGIVSYSMSK